MERYTPAIQDAFRRTGFPIERAGKVRQVTFGPSDSAPVQMVEQQRWEYRNREETWSVLVTADSVILQTTAYTRFEEFAERLQLAVSTVLTESELAQFGVVHRVGLRYIDMVHYGRDAENLVLIRRPRTACVSCENWNERKKKKVRTPRAWLKRSSRHPHE